MIRKFNQLNVGILNTLTFINLTNFLVMASNNAMSIFGGVEFRVRQAS